MPNIFISSFLKSTVCIPQSAISTNPQISHLEKLGFKPEKEENKVNVFTSSSIDPNKNLVSSAYSSVQNCRGGQISNFGEQKPAQIHLILCALVRFIRSFLQLSTEE